MTPLDPRLRVVAEAVRPGAVVADVGTDHGYLICELVGTGKCPRGYASDIGIGPLEAARSHIRERGLWDRIEALLSDGLRELPGQEIGSVVIAGMGGELIAEILTAVQWTRDPDKQFILQPMTRADHLRRALYRAGFALLEETAVESGRFVYTVMTAGWTGELKEIDERFAQSGLHWGKTDRDSRLYLGRVAARLEKQAKGLERARGETGKAIPLHRLVREIKEKISSFE